MTAAEKTSRSLLKAASIWSDRSEQPSLTMTQNTYGVMHSQLPRHNMLPATYSQYSNPILEHDHSNIGIDTLTEGFGNFNVRNTSNSDHGNFNATTMDSKRPVMDAYGRKANRPAANGQVLYQLEDGTFVYSQSPQYNYSQYASNHLATPYTAQYSQPSYASIGSGNHAGLSTPREQTWMPSHHMAPVPELVAPRRTSYSSNEEASPQTPAFGNWQHPIYISGRSPTAWSTPSPMSGHTSYVHVAKGPNGETVTADFAAWCNQAPAIPEPVPARHSGPDGGRGSLEKILDNPDGTTNVYVRGLQPDTTDELLGLYGRRFGHIESQKAIIDHSNGTCKGFGFIKYGSYWDAENCIRAFWHRGYEAKFARQSHNARLKELADENNTNLYVSNLPKLINEDGLKSIFASVFPAEAYPQHRAGSCKILKDSCGISRGVGFARFETTETCEQIIAAFNNKVIGDGKDATTLQIRYADTEEQKKLKTYTAIKRQFKADEYNEAVYGIPFANYSALSPSFHSAAPARGSNISGSWINPSPMSSISPASYSSYPHSMLRARRTSSGLAESVPITARPSAHIKIESPSVLAAAKKAAADAVEDTSTDIESSTKSSGHEGAAALVSTLAYTNDLVVDSPTKSKL